MLKLKSFQFFLLQLPFLLAKSLSTHSQFRIFTLFFDFVNDITAYECDSSSISLFTKEKEGFVFSLSSFEILYHINLTTLNTSDKNSSLSYGSSLQYPRGLFSLNSIFFLYDAEENLMNSFIDTEIKTLVFLDPDRLIIFPKNDSFIKILNFSSIIQKDNSSIMDIETIPNIEIIEFSAICPIILITDSSGNSFILHKINKKVRKLTNPLNLSFSPLPFIKETIVRSLEECQFELNIDFELEDHYFIISCKEKLFIFAFASAMNQNFSINHIYYRNPVERMFLNSSARLKIIEGSPFHLLYAIISSEAVCYYYYEPFLEDFKYFSNRRVLCMRNSIEEVILEDISFNQENSYVILYMRNITDQTMFFPAFHRCVLNMHATNFICQICNSFYCPKQCERYQYPGCTFVGEVQKTFFMILTMMIMISIAFLCCAHICKNRANVCGVLLALLNCLFSIFKHFFCMIRNLWNKNCIRRLKYMKSYAVYWCKCGWRKLEEEKNCPICLENINIRPKMFFACGRHEVHTDCFQHYAANNLENNKKEGCPFRDA